MQVHSITGDTMKLLYDPSDAPALVGQQFQVIDDTGTNGLLVQVIANEMLRGGDRSPAAGTPERSPAAGTPVRMAVTKVRKRITAEAWTSWDGWIPSGAVSVARVAGADVLRRLRLESQWPLRVASLEGEGVDLDARRLDMINLITGAKGSGKSHLAKNILLQLAALGVPCVVFDINREYVDLPGARTLRWGDNFLPDLLEVGFDVLSAVVAGVHPLSTANAIAIFENRGPQIFADRIEFFGGPENAFFSLADLMQNTAQFRAEDLVTTEIVNRLRSVDSLNLFARKPEERTSFKRLYREVAGQGGIVVLDLHNLRNSLRRTLVHAVIQHLEAICEEEHDSKAGRYPFVFYEEAHFYADEASIINIITRGRHIGIAPFFITNSPDKLPEAVFRQLDSMFLLQLLHDSDIRHVCKSTLTDEATIESMVTRMPRYHALIVGRLTEGYPLVVSVNPLDPAVAPTGRTRSTWDRMKNG